MALPASAGAMVSDYERLRQERIAENKRKIQELGLAEATAQLQPDEDEKPARKPRSKAPKVEAVDPADLRRSGRERTKISYKEEDMCPDLRSVLGARGPRAPPRSVDEEEIEELRRKHGIMVEAEGGEETAAASQEAGPSSQKGSGKGRKQVDSGKGVRVQGGRVYDSKFGVTCHWCRQKTLEDHVTCTRPNCGGGRRLPTSFCKMCLRNRHGEDCDAAAASGKWVCPQCRGSCGKGCVSCCNCGPCRKKLELEPTRQVVGLAKAAGFTNVHDYLVHIVTGETCEVIAARKATFSWGAWVAEGPEDWLGRSEEEVAAVEAGAAQAEAAAGAGAGPSSEAAGAKASKRGRGGKRKAAGTPAAKEAGSKEEAGDEEEAGATAGTAAKKARKGAGRGERAAAQTPKTPKTRADAAEEEEGEGQAEEEREVPQSEPKAPEIQLPEGVTLTKKQRKQLELGLTTLEAILAAKAKA